MKTDYSSEDLSYEELYVNKDAILNSSHWQSWQDIYRLIKLSLKVISTYGKRIYCKSSSTQT
jgi:hypothetical protein